MMFCSSLASLLWRLWCHLSRRRRMQFSLVLGLMLISALAETISLGAVLPFLGILVAPEKIFENVFVAGIAHNLGITAAAEMILPISIVFALAAIIAGGMRMLLLWTNSRLSYASGSDISFDIYRRTLYQPYSVHISRNSSRVSSGLDYKVDYTVNVLLQVLILVSALILIIALMVALLAIDPSIASMAVLGFGTCYVLISKMFRKRLVANAERIARETTRKIKAVHEGLGGIRDILLDGTQPFYCDVYRQADYPLRAALGNNIFIGGSPRFAMEALGIVLIIILAYTLNQQAGGVAATLPVLGALVLGAQRLIPALQQCYAAWASIMGSKTALAETLEFLDQPLPEDALKPSPPPLSFKKIINIKNIDFKYTKDSPFVLKNLSLDIRKGEKVGIVGGTGSGKSTLLDLLMGLTRPTGGLIRVDGKEINNETRRAWQQTIAHVPQSIYLADTTLAENIAFGIPREKMDMDRIRLAAQHAQISEFIEGLPENYSVLVGERGVRLSGGQRQRIGIARALYKQAAVLIFDEATSALDNTTEQDVMSALEKIGKDLTLVMVAHRLSTVRRCDKIVELGEGRVIAEGNYDYLFANSPSFRQMATAPEKT